ncbi:MAG: twin-arginine translocation signal domain-containing protein, partial [Xanthomonadaceae bacterium]|nr:twin-arginine translocation signal domain-containing protein [Xanthomonadaceae bacterium]
MTMLTRRQFLANTAIGAASLLVWPKLTLAATGSDTRFLFVLLRGGLDGLESVPPYGDPGYAAIRGALALSPSAVKPAHKLDNVFALHPSFDYAAQLYAQGQFIPVVATAPPYW